MNLTPEHVELIVQRVLEHLRTPANTVAPSVPVLAETAPTKTEAPRGVSISDAVITQSLLAGSINGSKVVRIGPRAILTPSARDFVRERGIDVVREAAGRTATTGARWQILVTTPSPQIASAVDDLAQIGIACDRRLLGLPAEAATQAIGALSRGEAAQVVVFTNQPELVTCLVNRNERVRAAAVADVPSVERTKTNLKPNLLAIDPTNKGAFELRALLRAFGTASSPEGRQ